MSSEEHQAFIEQVLSAYRPDETPDAALVLADYFTERGDQRHTATALDRAYGLRPDDQYVVQRRQAVLDELEVVEHGIRFRYVPAGSFLMGSQSGDHDELPVHPVRLNDYWVAETPVTWSTYCDVVGVDQPPENSGDFSGYAERIQTSANWGWQETQMKKEEPEKFHEEVFLPNSKLQCTVDGQADYPVRLLQYDCKPMVSVTEKQIKRFLTRLSASGIHYDLPTEQEWEKAARGGLINQRYPWGDAAPDHTNCDFGVLTDSDLSPSKSFPPNGYGLYAMSGGVWEWTASRYNSQSYSEVGEEAEPKPKKTGFFGGKGKGKKKQGEVLFRGGSWADCAEAATVSFRMSASTSIRSPQTRSPTFGFRILRKTTEQSV